MPNSENNLVVGIIGGSGLYDMDGLSNTRWQSVESPFGAPSDELFLGELAGIQLVFLPRHGRGHVIPPSEVNYRANIDALKRAGCTEIISLSACGSLNETMAPGDFVIADQFIDRTFAQEKSFFGTGLVAHVAMGHPVCPRLGDALEHTTKKLGINYHRGGTYLAIESPQFSSLAESQLYRSWSCDVIGMTNMPEAKLAREAELCYSTVAMVTDYDCWHPEHDEVNVDEIIRVLLDNADKARELVKAVVPILAKRQQACTAGCQHALDNALITAPEKRDRQLMAKLDVVAGRVLKRIKHENTGRELSHHLGRRRRSHGGDHRPDPTAPPLLCGETE